MNIRCCFLYSRNLLFLIILFMFCSHRDLYAKSLTIEEFVAAYLTQSSDLEKVKLEKEKIAIDEMASKDLHKTILLSEFDWSRKKEESAENPSSAFGPDRVPSQSFEDYDIRLGVSQELSRGTKLKMEHYSSYIKGSKLDNFRPEANTSLTLSLDLLKKLDGEYDSVNKSFSEAMLEVAKLKVGQSFLEECFEASKIYLNTYFQQEILTLYEENLNDAKEVFSSLENLYSRKQLQKIDFIRAKQDVLDMKSFLEEQDLRYRKKRLRISSYLKTSDTDKLVKPVSTVFSNINLDTVGLSDSLSLKELRVRVDAATSRLKLENIESRPDLSLDFSLTKYEQEQAFFPKRDGVAVGVGISFTLPVVDRSRTDRIRQAALDQRIENEALRDRKRSLEIDLSDEITSVKSYKSRKSIIEKRLKNAERGLIEARRLMNLGRMDITDYIKDRRRVTDQKIDLIRISLLEIESLININQYTNTTPTICEKGE